MTAVAREVDDKSVVAEKRAKKRAHVSVVIHH